MKKFLFLFLFFILSTTSRVYAQNIEVDANNMPLNEVLISLRDKYHLHFSFNDQLLSHYRLTLSGSFKNPREAIETLIKGYPLTFYEREDIFIILPEKRPLKSKSFLLAGKVIESGTNESMPYANVRIGERIINCDQNGTFICVDNQDSLFHVSITYLSHYVFDTIVPAGNNYRFKLIPSSIGLREVVIKGQRVDRTMLIGDKAGVMKANPQIARFIPGNDDNSVFNLLRLMPGILASSEQSNGLVIWGSYEGFNQILFDGFTIWGLKNFSDDINAVNPLLVKEMEVLKGGYDASFGDRVGGIVRISGKNGNFIKPSLTFNVNNVTMNGIVETPLWRNSSILFSFRKTYYNQYQDKEIIPPADEDKINQRNLKKFIDYTVFPMYNFNDANIKFSSKNDKGDIFFISILGGQDRFKYTINRTQTRNEIERTKGEKNQQAGASAVYGKVWKNGNSSNLTASVSGLSTDLTDVQKIFRSNGTETTQQNYLTSNNIIEYSFKSDHWFTLNKSNRIETGAGYIKNAIGLEADSSGIKQTSLKEHSERVSAFLQDHISLPGNMTLTAGIRSDYPLRLAKLYLQPRISAVIELNKSFKINLAWGIYNQFITQSSVLDSLGNYRYVWTGCNNSDVPVLRSQHLVAGSSFKKNNFTLSVESYYKTTDGITRFINVNQNIRNKVFQGIGRSYGVDFFIRKDYKGHSAWFSYTLSKTEEKFPYFMVNEFRSAPQDQRHEFKGALMLNLKPFILSANYVFGSGFPLNAGTILNPIFFEPDYNRLDASLICRFKIRKILGEAGLSVLNIMDSKNIRYSNFEKVPLDQINSVNIYSEAVPFSPRVFCKIEL